MRKKLSAFILFSIVAAYSGSVLAAPLIPTVDLAGIQLSKDRENLERDRISEEIENDKKNREQNIDNDIKPQDKEHPDITFELKAVNIDKSEILTADVLEGMYRDYIGKEVTVKDLYDIVAAINEKYKEAGYITCQAYLPPQTISGGTVKIGIIEGVNGDISVVDNKYTERDYITDRVKIGQGKIININDLNKDLVYFNGTNDVMLRIAMQAGKVPGTTDYILKAYEPQNQVVTVFSDNAGSTSSGEWRQGLFYNIRSLSGVRDNLNVNLMRSDGTRVIGVNYGRVLGRSGTKLNIGFSANTLKMTDGSVLETLGVKGHSQAITVGLSQPLMVTAKTKKILSIDFGNQNSVTDIADNPWVNDTINEVTLGYAITSFYDSAVVYQKHSYNAGSINRIVDFTNGKEENESYGKYAFYGIYQKQYNHGQKINLRLDGQWSSTHYMPSSRQYILGGAYSIRGYKENIMSADNGYSYSLEYSVPVFNKQTNMYVFNDGGYCFGVNAPKDHNIFSWGLGIKTTINKNIFANLSVGFPLVKTVNNVKYDPARINFTVSAQF